MGRFGRCIVTLCLLFPSYAFSQDGGVERRSLTPPPPLSSGESISIPAQQSSDPSVLAARANVLMIEALDLREECIGSAKPMTGLGFYMGRSRVTDAIRYRAAIESAIDAAEQALDAGARRDALDVVRQGVLHLTSRGLPRRVAVALIDADAQTLEDDAAIERLGVLRDRLE